MTPSQNTYVSCIAFGASVGTLEEKIQRWQACQHLLASQVGEVMSISDLYVTTPWGGVARRDFLNSAWLLQSDLTPQQQLAALLGLEKRFHRQRHVRWRDRTLDLDLLWCSNRHHGPCLEHSPPLQLPHPGLCERAFMWMPFQEVWQTAIEQNLFHPSTADLKHVSALQEQTSSWQKTWPHPWFKDKTSPPSSLPPPPPPPTSS